ncbi:MAG: ATP-binding domain-containing protein [Anaerolineae bacterium]
MNQAVYSIQPGSKYRAVVIPLLTQHYMLLQRNLFYIAITRARELVVRVR